LDPTSPVKWNDLIMKMNMIYHSLFRKEGGSEVWDVVKIKVFIVCALMLVGFCAVLPGSVSAGDPPVAMASPDFQTVEVGVFASFDGSASWDPEGNITQWEWDFGDGWFDSGEFVSHPYDFPGWYNVTLTVTDDEMLTDWYMVQVEVTEPAPDYIQFQDGPGPVASPLVGPFAIAVGTNFGHIYAGAYNVTNGWLYDIDHDWSFASNSGGTLSPGTTMTFSQNYTSGPFGGVSDWVNITYMGIDAALEFQVLPPTVDHVEIRDGPGAAASGVPDQVSIGLNATYPTLYAAAFNYTLGYMFDIDQTWSFSNPSGGTLVPGTNPSLTQDYTSGFFGGTNDWVNITYAGCSDSVRFDVTGAPNQPPVADARPPYQQVNVWENAIFSGNSSYDPDGFIASYYWDFGDGNYSTEMDPAHAYEVPGWYNVTLTVTDDMGANDTAYVDVEVLWVPQPPVAMALPDYQQVNVSEPAQLYGYASWDPDGSIASYFWDFGDGNFSFEVDPNHTYSAPGTYNVFLTVTDNDNLTDTDNATVEVVPANQPPVADAEPGYQMIAEGETAIFWDNASYDPDGFIVSYYWDFGDGNDSWEQYPSHTYYAAGFYNVTLTVTDDQGATDFDTVFVEVVPANQPPVADAEPEFQQVYAGDPVFFIGNGSYDPDGFIVNYTWDLGDGNYSWDVDLIHVYFVPGWYNVTLTVTDDGALTGFDTVVVEVIPVPLPKMHVESIDIVSTPSLEKNGRVKYVMLQVTVQIADENGTGVAGATVYGSLTGPGNTQAWYEGTTGPDGNVTFNYTRSMPGGARKDYKWLIDNEYTFTVYDVQKPGWEYDPDSNVETSESVLDLSCSGSSGLLFERVAVAPARTYECRA